MSSKSRISTVSKLWFVRANHERTLLLILIYSRQKADRDSIFKRDYIYPFFEILHEMWNTDIIPCYQREHLVTRNY